MKNKLYTIFSESGCPSNDILKKYLNGELSHKQQHEIEKHLIDCEMCSDELEGLRIMNNPKEFNAIVDRLNNKIINKFRFKFINTYGKIAAALLILISIGSLFVLFNNYKNTNIKNSLAEDLHPSKIQTEKYISKNNDKSSLKIDKTISKPKIKNQSDLQNVYKNEPKTTTKKQKKTEIKQETENNIANTPVLELTKNNTKSTATTTLNTSNDDKMSDSSYKSNEQISENISEENYKENNEISSALETSAPANNISSEKSKHKNAKKSRPTQNSFYFDNKNLQNNDLLNTAIENYSAGKYSKAKKQLEKIIKNKDFAYIQKAQWYYALTLIKLNKINRAKNILKKISETVNHKYYNRAKEKLQELNN